jgi:hypothetical protein
VKRLVVHSSLMCGAVLILSFVAGCAGKGELRQFDLQTKQSPPPSTGMEPVKIVIEPFEDRRMDKSHIGSRSHLWGGVTHFDVTGGRPADVLAQALVSRLQSRGWGDRPWNVRLGQAGSAAEADIVISGQVEDFSANAKSRVFSTVIDTKTRFAIQAKNLADSSTTTRTIEGVRSRTVLWFDEEDVRELLADTLNDGIDRVIVDTKIAQKALRPVR